MAAGRERVSRKRKRKLKRATHRKLGVGQKVEVRSIEDGFLGSWHLGTVISCSDLVREVEYDYILSEKGSGKLVEVVRVSPIVDGFIPADDQIVHQLGIIRPSPPPYESGSWPYGQCVDFFYQDAWWEGVMFDREEGDDERKVFFPELGDEMKAELDKLRITQDWDEVTEDWKPRGSWIFLEVVEEIEKLNPLIISVKQIWYEVQLKDGFDEHLKQWTSTSKDIWRRLVKEVVHDNTKLTVKHFLSDMNSSQIPGEGSQLLKFSELAFEAELNLEKYFDNSIAPSTEAACTLDSAATLPMDQDAYHLQLPMDHYISHHQLPIDQDVPHFQPVEKQFVSEEFAPVTEDVQLCGNDDCESIPPSQKEDSSASPHDFSVLPSPEADITGILSSNKSEPPTFMNSKLRRSRPPTKKKKFKRKTLIGEPDSCSEADLTRTSKTKPEDVSHLQQPMDQDVCHLQLPIDQDVSDPQPVEKQFVSEDFAPATEDVQLSGNDDCILSSTKSEPPTLANSKTHRGRPPTKKKKFEGQTRVGEPDSCLEANSTNTIKKKKFEDDCHLQLSMNQDVSQLQPPMDQDISHLRLPTDQDFSHLRLPTDQDISHLQLPMDQDVSHLRLPTDQDISHLQLPMDQDVSHLRLPTDQDVSDLPPVEKQIVSEYFAPATEVVQLSGNDDCILSSTKREPPTFANSKPCRGRPRTKKKKFQGQNRVGEPDSCTEATSTKTIKKKKFEDDSHLQLSQDVSQPMDQDVSHLRLPMDQDVSHFRLPMDQDVFHLPPVEKQIGSEDFAPVTEAVQLSGNDDCRSISPSQKEDSSLLPRDPSVLPPSSHDMDGSLSSTKSQPLIIANSKPCRGRPPTKKKKLEGQIGIGQSDSCSEANSTKTFKKPPSDDTAGILSSTKSKSQTLEKFKPRRGRPPTKKKKFEGQTLVSVPDSCPEATLIKESEKPPSDDMAGITSHSKSEQPTFVNSKSCRGGLPTKKKEFDWQSLAGEPDSCLEVITKCMPSMPSIKKFKKHLLYSGWKFELKMENGKIKKNYIAPNGSICKSLCEVCQVLEESKIFQVVPPVEQSSLPGDTDNSTKSPCVGRPTCSEVHKETRIEHEETRIEPEEKSTEPEETRSDPEETRTDPEETRIEPEETRIDPEETMIEPEMCHQAVIDYCFPKSQDTSAYQKSYRHGVKIGDTSLKAKKHLAATGWKFYSVGKNHKRYHYRSPEGKTFQSFRKACKWCVNQWEAEGHLSEQVSSPSTATKNSCERSPVEVPLISLVRESRKKRKHANVKSRPSLKKGDGDMRSSKRAREVAPSSCNQTPRTVLSWLIDNNVVLPRAKVKYCRKKNGNPLAEGRITREGIKCNCCQKIFGLCNFEAHAGSGCNRPSANLYFEDGRSLLECQMQLKPKQSVENEEGSHFTSNDYICSVCHYGGDLILCDGCPSSFHVDCLGIKEVPDGDWFCPSCCCKVCGESIFVKNRNQFTDDTGLICCQCNHKYHARCMRGKGPGKLDDFPEGNWFCNKRCELIFLGMHHLLKKSIIVGNDNLTWTLLKYIEPDDDESSVEIYTRLCVTLNVMHECFEPVKELLTGRDIVEDVIFSRWSELNRLNFQGFYTVLLERNEELISVATVRVFGEKVAEIPLVATQFQHRRLGMCRILMNELEKKLTELGVERLVLPAVSGVLNTWTTSFGFSVVEQSERANFLDYTFLDFQGTIMCQKILKKTPAKSQQAHVDNTKSKDNVESDENVAISEVFQATQVDGCATVDQGYVG